MYSLERFPIEAKIWSNTLLQVNPPSKAKAIMIDSIGLIVQELAINYRIEQLALVSEKLHNWGKVTNSTRNHCESRKPSVK